MLASTGPVTGQQYVVDTFIVVVFGGVESLLGTILSAFIIGELQSTFEFLMTGSDGQGFDPAAGDRCAVLPPERAVRFEGEALARWATDAIADRHSTAGIGAQASGRRSVDRTACSACRSSLCCCW
mgnify:CR=1 FL=1